MLAPVGRRPKSLDADRPHRALELCHFNPDTGADLGKAEHAQEKCQAACYDCLLSYFNQPDHESLDRHCVKDLLQQIMTGSNGTVARWKFPAPNISPS